MTRKRRRSLMSAAAAIAVVMAFAACGPAAKPSTTPTVPSAATAFVSPAPTTTIAPTAQESPTAIPTDTPAIVASTPTPTPPGETGIAGTVTVGPTCPVERIDSPCPDRPYEARITIWQGTAMVAETRSGADGRFTVRLAPGDYRVVGESGSTFPRGTEVTVTVIEGQLAPVTLRFDSGIR